MAAHVFDGRLAVAVAVLAVTHLALACSDAPPAQPVLRSPAPVNICDEAMARAEKSLQGSKDKWRDLVADAVKSCADQSAIESALSKHPGAVRADLNTIIANICTAKDLPDSVTRSTICNTNPEAMKLRGMLDKLPGK